MEKPGPVMDAYRRYGARESRDQSNASYRERVINRGIPVLRDTADEADTPMWRGDHSFNSDAASYSLMHFIEPEVAAEHPDWKAHQVKAEAQDRFTRRLAQDMTYEKLESNHKETEVRWVPIETSHGIELATDYGEGKITLRELWEHTKEYAEFVGNPAAYNPAEQQAQLEMQDAFIRGSATGFVSALSHPDSVRYIQVWEKHADGEVTSKQVDLYAATGRDFSTEESQQFIQHLAVFHHESVKEQKDEETQYAHFFIEKGRVNGDKVRLIATAFTMQQEIRIDDAPRRVHIAADSIRIMKDASDVMVVLGTYVHKEITEKIRDVFIQSPNKNHIRREQKHMQESRRVTQKHLPLIEHSAQSHVDRPTHTETPEFMKRTQPVLKEMIADWYISKVVVSRSADVPVGAQAALFWFQHMEHKSVETEVSTNTKECMTTPDVLPAGVSVASREIHPIKRLWNEVRMKLRLFIPVRKRESLKKHADIPSVTSFEDKPVVRHVLSLPLIQEAVRTWIRRSVETVVTYIHKHSSLSTDRKMDVVPKKTGVIKRTPLPLVDTEHRGEVAVRDIAVAVYIWRMLLSGRPAQEQNRHVADPHIETRTGKEPVSIHDRQSEDVPDPSVWVLLSILRYLTLVREAGMSGTHTQKNTGRATRRKKRTAFSFQSIVDTYIPSRTIIFTFAS